MKPNLIGVSGRLYAGKDAFAKAVLWIVNPGIHKDWGNDFKSFCDITPSGQGWGYEIKKFADKLKDICVILTGCKREQLESQDFKSTMSPLGITYRELLQKIGTEVGRNINQNVWVDSLFKDWNRCGELLTDKMTKLSSWIITDVRFPNEYQAIKDRGGIVVRIKRGTERTENLHPSETSLDNHEFDHVIYNIGTLEGLLKKTEQFYASIS